MDQLGRRQLQQSALEQQQEERPQWSQSPKAIQYLRERFFGICEGFAVAAVGMVGAVLIAIFVFVAATFAFTAPTP